MDCVAKIMKGKKEAREKLGRTLDAERWALNARRFALGAGRLTLGDVR